MHRTLRILLVAALLAMTAPAVANATSDTSPTPVLLALQGDSPGTVPAASPALPNSGELLRVNKDGTFTTVVGSLDRPTSLEFIGDAAFVTTLNGDVLRIEHVRGGKQSHED